MKVIIKEMTVKEALALKCEDVVTKSLNGTEDCRLHLTRINSHIFSKEAGGTLGDVPLPKDMVAFFVQEKLPVTDHFVQEKLSKNNQGISICCKRLVSSMGNRGAIV